MYTSHHWMIKWFRYTPEHAHVPTILWYFGRCILMVMHISMWNTTPLAYLLYWHAISTKLLWFSLESYCTSFPNIECRAFWCRAFITFIGGHCWIFKRRWSFYSVWGIVDLHVSIQITITVSKIPYHLPFISLAVKYLFLVNNGADNLPELEFEPFDARSTLNDYEVYNVNHLTEILSH